MLRKLVMVELEEVESPHARDGTKRGEKDIIEDIPKRNAKWKGISPDIRRCMEIAQGWRYMKCYETLPKTWREECENSDCDIEIEEHSSCDFYTERFCDTIGKITTKDVADYIYDKIQEPDGFADHGFLKTAEIEVGDFMVMAWIWTDGEDMKNKQMSIIAYSKKLKDHHNEEHSD